MTVWSKGYAVLCFTALAICWKKQQVYAIIFSQNVSDKRKEKKCTVY